MPRGASLPVRSRRSPPPSRARAGTGTLANDVNESDVTHAQLQHLGRSPGRPLLVVAQKHLTGHPKGAAAAWMINGALQALGAGVVPGNANADDVDEELRRFTHLAYPNAPLSLGPGASRAALVQVLWLWAGESESAGGPGEEGAGGALRGADSCGASVTPPAPDPTFTPPPRPPLGRPAARRSSCTPTCSSQRCLTQTMRATVAARGPASGARSGTGRASWRAARRSSPSRTRRPSRPLRCAL